MKSQSIFGVILIILGVVILTYQGFSFTHQTQLAKVGPVEVNGQKRETVAISPIIGGVCVAGGVVLLAMGFRRGN